MGRPGAGEVDVGGAVEKRRGGTAGAVMRRKTRRGNSVPLAQG